MPNLTTLEGQDTSTQEYLLKEYDLSTFLEVCQLVSHACVEPALTARVMKRVMDAMFVLFELTSEHDGAYKGVIEFNWLPVSYYMAITRGGKQDWYDGYKLAITCRGVRQAFEIFFSHKDTYGQHGVHGQAEIGGWTLREALVETDVQVAPKTEKFLVTLAVSGKVRDPETLGNGIRDAIETFRVSDGLTHSDDPEHVENVLSVEHLENN